MAHEGLGNTRTFTTEAKPPGPGQRPHAEPERDEQGETTRRLVGPARAVGARQGGAQAAQIDAGAG